MSLLLRRRYLDSLVVPAAEQSSAPAGSKRRRIQAEYKDRVYDFETYEEAQQFLLSLRQTYKPTRAERKKAKPGAILSPRVEFAIDDVPFRALNLPDWEPLDALSAGRFDLLSQAVQRILDDDEEAILVLLM